MQLNSGEPLVQLICKETKDNHWHTLEKKYPRYYSTDNKTIYENCQAQEFYINAKHILFTNVHMHNRVKAQFNIHTISNEG